MTRLTIRLSDERYRALKESAARRRKTIGAVIDECLAQAGITPPQEVTELVAAARKGSGLSEGAATALAVRETRATRRRRR